MYKRGLSLFLACLMVLSLTACGSSAPEPPATTAPAVQAEPTEVVETTEVITEPTLSPEEQLIASLPEKVLEAYNLGFVDLELLADLDRVCLGAEAAQIIQNIHVAHYGTESKIMNQVLEHEHANIEVTRFWLALTMFVAEAEAVVEVPSDDYLENLNHMLVSKDAWDAGFSHFLPGDGSYIYFNEEQNAYVSDAWEVPLDWEEINYWEQGQMYIDYTYDGSNLPMWVMSAYDRLTGEKIMSGSPDVPFRPRENMTVRDVVETTLRYHNWIPPQQELLPYEELPTYDTAIITSDLLNKETTLPEPSCQYLPESWHGIASTAIYGSGEQMPIADPSLQENEIQVIADAGFNFLRLHLDFKYFASDALTSWPGWANDPKMGYMNETRLKAVDQIIAWCIERDIHVNITCDGFIGWNPAYPPPFTKDYAGRSLAQQWAVFARRYADIPNTYLSFTMHDNPGIITNGQYRQFFTPIVEAIRAESPDRCIIADMGGRGAPGAAMAELGVALSAKAEIWHRSFDIIGEMKSDVRSEFFASATWPYEADGKVFDAESAMGLRVYDCDAPDTVAAVAEEYGVGFMVSGWDAVMRYPYPFPSERFTDEFMESYLNDFTQVLSDRGYGWCYGDHNGYVGLFAAHPIIESTTYTQVDNAPLYIDDEMMAWFKTINPVS